MPQVRTRAGGANRPFFAVLAAALAVLAAPACEQPPNTLEGSLGEVIDLEFTEVEVSITEWAIIVGFWKPHGEGRDIVFKLVANKRPDEVVPGQPIDLAPREDGTARATCTRSVAADPIRTYAAIKSGTLNLSAIPVLDRPIAGEYRVTLDEGGDAGKGRTAFGHFNVPRVAPGN
ncbi:MAG TPA: hypothetical protein VGK67_15575 [Myxococcales bacterium]|jgi:hypothetical protein